MSYPIDIQKPKNLRDVISRKEFAQLKLNNDYLEELDEGVNESTLDAEIMVSKNLQLLSQQQFVRNWISSNTPFPRLLMKHSTGTGKTIGSLSIAVDFMKHYKKMSMFSEFTPSVVIIGFSRHVFHKELLRHPEFGFISREEMEVHKELKRLESKGTQSDKDALTDFEMKIKKRFSNKHLGGFFKFFGYKEFFNRLFIFGNEEIDKANLNEHEIIEGVKKGEITINKELVKSMANSLVICDEIHNVYNSLEINNYGIALQMLLNLYDSPDEMQKTVPLDAEFMEILRNGFIKSVFMSATPINNSPMEIIDLLNLLVPLSRLGSKLKKEDFFIDNRTLKKGALDRIATLIRGYVSFFRDDNPKYFPRKILEGAPMKLPSKLSKDDHRSHAPYLKFTFCKMSPYHWKTYKQVYTGTLPPDGQSLVDFVLPNPEKSDKIGVFRTREIRHALAGATQKWKETNQIDLVKQQIGSSNEVDVLTGELMNINNLSKYTTKYYTMIKDLIDNVKGDLGKVMLIHQYVKMSGVLFIQEVLRRNGIIDEYANPTENTMCVHCGTILKNHKGTKNGRRGIHEFAPARFIILHGDIDKTTMDRSIEKYNSMDNLYGQNYKVLVGSKMIREAYDFNSVQHLWIMSVPTNIPQLIQIFGRPIRKNSHINLPLEEQEVRIRIYVSSTPDGKELSYEESRYYEKLKDYLVIQQLDMVFNENAIDATIHRQTIYPDEAIAKKTEPGIGALYFKPSNIFSDEVKISDVSSFKVFHADHEMELLVYIIKRLFIEQSPVWKYDTLWEMVQHPPFEVAVNTSAFDEENFAIALDFLIYLTEGYIDIYTPDNINRSKHVIDRLFDHLDKKIIKNGVECQIVYKNGYYILFPNDNIFNTKSYIAKQYKKDLARMKRATNLGWNATDIVGHPEIDVDNWYRHAEKLEKTVLNITDYLKTSNISYNNMKYKFFSRFKDMPIKRLPVSVEVYGMEFHARLIEDSIQYVFNVLTNPDVQYSELHEFYFKILYFYDKLDMILFASDVIKSNIYKEYKPFITDKPLKVKRKSDDKKAKIEIVREKNKLNAFLMSSLLKASNRSEVFNIDRINDFINKSRHSIGVKSTPKRTSIDDEFKVLPHKKITKVFNYMLPIGHFLAKEGQSSVGTVIPRIYHRTANGDSWKLATEFVEQMTDNSEENNKVIGYYEKNTTGIDVKFKLRPPIHKITKHSDSRMIERGSVCETRKKEDLMKVVKDLDIELKSSSIRDICNAIKFELMERELESRRNAGSGKRKRWFYLHFEPQP